MKIQLIPKSIIYAKNLVQQLSNCKKNLFQAECRQLVTANFGLIKNAKTCRKEKSVFVPKQKEQPYMMICSDLKAQQPDQGRYVRKHIIISLAHP